MKRIALALAGIIFVTSCAKNPDAITPATIPFEAYSNKSCSDIALELTNEKQNLESLSSQQRNAAAGDAVGVFLIGVPISSVTGNDKEGLISVSKGKIQAMEAAKIRNNCP